MKIESYVYIALRLSQYSHFTNTTQFRVISLLAYNPKESPPPIVISGWRLQIDWAALTRQHSIRYHNDLAKL